MIIKIIHISDLHFGLRSNRQSFLDCLEVARAGFRRALSADFLHFQGTHSEPIAKLLAKFINSSIDADFVVISGDLCCTGREEDISVGRDWLEKLENKRRIFITPGNHDKFKDDILVSPTSSHFYKYMGQYAGVNHCVLKIVEKKVAIISLDTTLRSFEKNRSNWPGNGKAYAFDMRALYRRVKNLREDGYLPLGLVTHFPLCECGRPTLELLDFQIASETLSCDRVNVPNILCGHTHYQEIKRTNVTNYISGTTCQTNVRDIFRGIYHIVRIDSGTIAEWSCLNIEFDLENRKFAVK